MNKKKPLFTEYGVYPFINSQDIREYLREQHYKFDPLQAAYLVWQSRRHTLEEKHQAWQEIIETLPDMPIPETGWCPGWESLHGFLAAYIEMERKYLGLLKQPEPNAVYTYGVKRNGIWEQSGEELFLAYEPCFLQAWLAYQENERNERFRIEKRWIDSPRGKNSLNVELDGNGRLMSLTIEAPLKEEEDLCYSFEGLWFDIPIPFRKGDLVCNSCAPPEGRRPFILEDTVAWYRKEHGIKRTDGDWTDMGAKVVYYDAEENDLEYAEGGPFDLNLLPGSPLYLNLEYYRQELKGGERMLKIYSSYLHGELDGIRFLKLMRYYRAEAERDSLSWVMENYRYLESWERERAAAESGEPADEQAPGCE